MAGLRGSAACFAALPLLAAVVAVPLASVHGAAPPAGPAPRPLAAILPHCPPQRWAPWPSWFYGTCPILPGLAPGRGARPSRLAAHLCPART